MDPKWLAWAKELQALAQTGLTYARDPYDIARYERVRSLASEIVATQTDLEQASIERLFTADAGHATPKVDVRGVVFDGASVLLVKERVDSRWSLPGGWADPGETAGESVVREVREESGYTVRATRLLALLDRDRQGHTPAPFYAYKAFFECEVTDAAQAPHDGEVEEVAFFPVDGLPPLSEGRVTPAQIHRLFELHRHPEWPADFD